MRSLRPLGDILWGLTEALVRRFYGVSSTRRHQTGRDGRESDRPCEKDDRKRGAHTRPPSRRGRDHDS